MGARATWRGYSRRRRVALAVALAMVAILLVLWAERKPIAGRYVDRALAAAKVPARYTIADLGLGRQRLTDVVIGDPADPDLVADWIETRTRLGLRGPELEGVRAGRLRVRGRLVDGRLSLGSIDRLLPRSTGGAFSLPRLDLDVEDGRMRLATPWGLAGVSLRGSGRLDGGFAGRVALVGERLGERDCAADRVAAVMQVRTRRTGASTGSLSLAGPLRAASVSCAGVTVAGLRSDVDAALATGGRPGWAVEARVATGRVAHRLAAAGGIGGTVEVAGGDRLRGGVDLSARDVRSQGVTARRVTLDGGVRREGGVFGYTGRVGFADADARALLPRIAAAGQGTPVAPLVARLTTAATAAARRLSGDAQIDATFGPDGPAATVGFARLESASGAVATLAEGGGIRWRAGVRPLVDGAIDLGGGGLPTLSARIRQVDAAPPRVVVAMRPYEAAGARLALTPVTIAGGRIATVATLSGPLGDGRVDGLTVPLDLRLTGSGVVANLGCTPVAFDRLAVSGLTLRPASLRLCPTGAALVRVADGRVEGGARIAPTRLTGALGTTPVTLAAAGATLRLADRGFALDGVETRIGAPGRVTRLDFARLEGRVAGGTIAGTFAGGAGQIANVPLLLSDAAGDWRFAGGRLVLTGALAVADAQAAAPRFQPMQARRVALALEDGAITAIGALHEPTTGTQVAAVAIRHALPTGTGEATLEVKDLTFRKGFQPELLTRLTYGVVADVAGTITGTGRIAWTPRGVTSTGTFRTAGTDLAAAFGPVTGIAGEIRFTDLLALESAPDQVATIASVNPGIAVTNGTVRYRLLPDTRVRVEGGEWPFAGGRLVLDPTLLDFGQPSQRRMTFRVQGMAADRFLQQFDFKNLDATGTFDGVLPMVFDDSGGRIEGGHMTVREGGGTIRYVGELSEKQLGFWGDFAFQALKSIRYRSLTLTMNGPLSGEMVTEVRFAGVQQGAGAKTNFLIRRLQRLPLIFNVRITAPFRGLIDSAQSFYDPSRLIQRNLPTLLDAGSAEPNGAAPARAGRSVQPPASAPVRKD